MILEFSIQNFRSIKNQQVFSMVAESGRSKSDNVFEATLPNENTVRVLKSAMIYGANASGKSNLIKAFQVLQRLVLNSATYRAGQPIQLYNPFVFSESTAVAPTVFELTFVFNNVKFQYEIKFNSTEVVSEVLDYFPKGQPQNIFKRPVEKSESELLHTARLGTNHGNKNIEVFKNQLLLSKFGSDIPHELLSNLYTYFQSIEIWDGTKMRPNNLVNQMAERFSNPEKAHLLKRLERMIRVADTKIESIGIEDKPIKFRRLPEGAMKELIEKQVIGRHPVYENGEKVDSRNLSFQQESVGTNALFGLGAMMLERLENGGVIIFDEFDNSLHPKLAKFLVQLFSSPVANPKNAQLILATHETTLLDRDLFRTDQIWIVEKNEFGETEFFSAQDFEGIREDVPFDKWYLAGKFGGLPKIEDLEQIFLP